MNHDLPSYEDLALSMSLLALVTYQLLFVEPAPLLQIYAYLIISMYLLRLHSTLAWLIAQTLKSAKEKWRNG